MISVGLDTSALDSSFKEHAARGIGRYVSELRSFFDRQQIDDCAVGFFDHRDFHAPAFLERAVEMLPAGKNTIKMQVLYPFQLNRNGTSKFDVLHFPAHMDAPSWSPKNYIITVLDLIPIVCAEMYRADRSGARFEFARWLERRAIQNASLVVAISHNTARDVNRILGVPEDRIVVTHLGVDKKFFETPKSNSKEDIRAKYAIAAERPVILYVGGIDQRKNIDGLLEALKGLKERFVSRSKPAPCLLMAGRIEQDRQYPRLLSLIEQLDLSNDVILTGYVDDLELLELYSISNVFFFPSLYEGFGLPPLEAMAAGTPVVSSNTSAMPEVLGESAIMYDPRQTLEAVEALERVITDSDLALKLSDTGQAQARRFTWDQTGEATISAYRRFAELKK